MTTAIYANRMKDKQQLENSLKLREDGDSTTEFWTPLGTLFAVGYRRVVYGDHGPYLEFDREHIVCDLRKKFSTPLPDTAYYEWLKPADGSLVKVYDQKRDVKNIPFAPKGGHREYRKEGYADYVPGKIYVNPYELKVVLTQQKAPPRKRLEL